MAVFECDRCGKCCVSLGPLITIERQLNDRDYYCRCKIDNAIFVAHVDPAYREDIADTFADGDCGHSCGGNRSCMFLRKNREGEGSVCAIYSSRPNVCRDFRCYHMLIRNSQGMICGRVIGKNTLRTEDIVLRRIWDEEVMPVPYGDPVAWRKKAAGILVRIRVLYRSCGVKGSECPFHLCNIGFQVSGHTVRVFPVFLDDIDDCAADNNSVSPCPLHRSLHDRE